MCITTRTKQVGEYSNHGIYVNDPYSLQLRFMAIDHKLYTITLFYIQIHTITNMNACYSSFRTGEYYEENLQSYIYHSSSPHNFIITSSISESKEVAQTLVCYIYLLAIIQFRTG